MSSNDAPPRFVYRFMKLAEFLDIVINQRMKLTQIDSWVDKHETFTLHTAIEECLRGNNAKKPTVLFAPDASADKRQRIDALRIAFIELNRRSMYAMCCTEKENSDAMWKVFADETGIRVKIDANELFRALRQERPNAERNAVLYYPTEKSVMDSDFLKKILGQKKFTLASCCFFKRDAFEHEKEYRFCDARYPDGYDELKRPMEKMFMDEKKGRFDGPAWDEMAHRLQAITFPPFLFFPFPLAGLLRVTLAPNCEWLEPAVRALLVWRGQGGITVDTSTLYKRPES
jgi:hypothetical protein